MNSVGDITWPQSIFRGMFSLLNPQKLAAASACLTLPPLFEGASESRLDLNFKSTKRKLKQVTACPHTLRRHYAKNMCNHCYHRKGRNKNAWDCQHLQRQLYAKGKCQSCYLRSYNKRNSRLKD